MKEQFMRDLMGTIKGKKKGRKTMKSSKMTTFKHIL